MKTFTEYLNEQSPTYSTAPPVPSQYGQQSGLAQNQANPAPGQAQGQIQSGQQIQKIDAKVSLDVVGKMLNIDTVKGKQIRLGLFPQQIQMLKQHLVIPNLGTPANISQLPKSAQQT